MSLLSLPDPAPSEAVPAYAAGSRQLAGSGRPFDRAALAHHVAVLPLPARTLALVTGNAQGVPEAYALLVRWTATRLRSLSACLVSGEVSGAIYRQEVAGMAAMGPDPAPAGEEMLVGLVATARRLAASRVLGGAAVAAFQASVAGVGGPDVPPALRRALEDASRGGFPGPVATLVDLLGDAAAEDGAVKDAAARLAFGGTRPGADTLAGIVALARDVALGSL